MDDLTCDCDQTIAGVALLILAEMVVLATAVVGAVVWFAYHRE